jgi:methylated-DNA-[protein]-cysteine S-methyltransferase
VEAASTRQIAHPDARGRGIDHLVRAMRTRYSVAAWGVGELWMLGDIVLAHDFRFLVDGDLEGHAEGAASALGARPPKGAQGPPTSTVAAISSRMGHDIVSSQHRGNGTSQCVTPDELGARVNDYLAGSNVSFRDVELDLSWATPFQCAVADALRGVPRGEVVTYGELAALAGFPGAARAAGSFCARNRFALLVPCHRVVAAAGIGAYGTTGTGIKRRLLALEGVVA